jgi:hypothetical protein
MRMVLFGRISHQGGAIVSDRFFGGGRCICGIARTFRVFRVDC